MQTLLTGQVRDATTGAPIPGATVVVTDSAGHVYTLTTNTSGGYAIAHTPTTPLTPGSATVSASATGYAPASATPAIVGGQVNIQDLTLMPNTLTGVVTDARTGLPIPGATVGVTDSAGHVFTTATNASGSYTVTSTVANPLVEGPATVSGSATGYGTTSASPTLNPGPNTQNLALPPTVLIGVISDAVTGLPIPGAAVTVTDNANHVYTTTANASGAYTFTSTVAKPLAPGSATVRASATGYIPGSEGVTLVSGTTNVRDVALMPTTLTGVVTDTRTGFPIPGAVVTFTDSLGTVFTATTGASGAYTFTGTVARPIVGRCGDGGGVGCRV